MILAFWQENNSRVKLILNDFGSACGTLRMNLWRLASGGRNNFYTNPSLESPYIPMSPGLETAMTCGCGHLPRPHRSRLSSCPPRPQRHRRSPWILRLNFGNSIEFNVI